MKTTSTRLMLATIMAAIAPFFANAETWTTNNVTYNYTVSNGKASIYNGYSAAIWTRESVIEIPTTLGEEQYPVTSIGEDAFYGCSGLTSVTIPDSVMSIGDSAFYGCSGLTSVTIPDSVMSIGDSAFEGCSGLTSVTIGNGVTSIGYVAFSGCSDLMSFAVGSENANYSSANGLLLSRDGNLIRGVNGDVTIPDGVTSIGYAAFSGCSGLTSVTIPDSVTSIGSSAFLYCSGLMSFAVGSGNANYSSANGLLLSKDGKTLIQGVNGDVTIPDSVTSIGGSAFSGCSGLTSVTIPDSVTSIGYAAFSGCSGLTSVTIPDSVMSIEDYAFNYCSGLMSFAVGSGNANYSSANGLLLSKEGNLIRGVNGDVTIPDGVTSIWNSAFSGCSGLTSVTIPDSVWSIGQYAFRDCSGLTSVTIPDSVYVRFAAFEGCSSLASVTIGESEAREAFCGCSGPRDVTVSQYVLDCKIRDVFSSACSLITNVSYSSVITNIGSEAFFGCSGLTSVTIPDSVTSIGVGAFCDCSGLTSVTIPNSVTSIGGSAFERCSSLASVTIGGSVTSIVSYAFYGCSGLTSVTMKGDAPSVGSRAFDNIGEGAVVHLPRAASGYVVDGDGKWQGMTVEWYWPGFTIDENGVLTGVDLRDATKVVIPDSVTSIGENAFEGCVDLTGVTIPDGVETISPTAFNGCGKLWAKWFRTFERLSDSEAVATVGEVTLTVTNVVVHYVTTAAMSEAVTPSEDVGIVNVIAEVRADNKPVAVSSAWAAQYGEAFTEKFGTDFAASVTATTGKRDGAGNLMQVWQDYVADTDPTDENDKFTASITFDADGKPQIAYSPVLIAAEVAKRKYTTYGKAKLNDKEWTEVAPGEEDGYNFFKVTVEMR